MKIAFMHVQNMHWIVGGHMLCAYFTVTSSFLSTELIALNDDLFQLAPELGIHVFHASYLQQRCLQSQHNCEFPSWLIVMIVDI